MNHHPRYYLDTSVIGGCLDEEFSQDSLQLLDLFINHKATLLLSPIILKELENAPLEVQEILTNLPEESIEPIELKSEVYELRDAYIEAQVLSPKWLEDATHVALATIYKADLIISWNFKHLVNVIRIRSFNAVNLKLGYQQIDIRSPKEVIHHENENI